MRCYRGNHGLLFVHGGINGTSWSTYYRTRTGSLRRLKTMPVRETREAAQADLDAYAEAKRLLAYEIANP
ncbi:MAG: hypothetical protein ACM309_09675 [Bacillota bacterium]